MRRTTLITLFHILGLATLVWGLACWLGESLTFFASDNGVRFIQIRSLIDQNWQTLAIDYPGRQLDPELNYLPYYYAHALLDGEIFFQITPYLPIVAAWLFKNAGILGLTALPVFGSIFTAIAVYKLTKLLKLPHPHLMLWATVFATPILFYSLELWDHTLAAAFATWGMYGLAKGINNTASVKPLVWAGILLALGAGQRPEMYLFIVASGVSFVWLSWGQWRQIGALVAGGIVGILPIWISQYMWVGHPLGMAFAPHLFGYGKPPNLVYAGIGYSRLFKMGRFLFHIEPRDIITFSIFLSMLIGFVFFGLAVRMPRWQRPKWLVLAMVFLVIQSVMITIYSSSMVFVGLVTVFPLFGLAVIFVNSPTKNYRLLAMTALFFVGGMVVLWPSYGGEQWGARYLLPAYPLLLLLANFHYNHYRQHLPASIQPTFLRAVFLLLVITIRVQGAGVRYSHYIHQLTATNRQELVPLPEIIISNYFFLPSDMASMADKKFFSVATQDQFDTLLTNLKENDIVEVGIIINEYTPLEIPPHLVTETAPLTFSFIP
jgi:hypothetical protein